MSLSICSFTKNDRRFKITYLAARIWSIDCLGEGVADICKGIYKFGKCFHDGFANVQLNLSVLHGC